LKGLASLKSSGTTQAGSYSKCSRTSSARVGPSPSSQDSYSVSSANEAREGAPRGPRGRLAPTVPAPSVSALPGAGPFSGRPATRDPAGGPPDAAASGVEPISDAWRFLTTINTPVPTDWKSVGACEAAATAVPAADCAVRMVPSDRADRIDGDSSPSCRGTKTTRAVRMVPGGSGLGPGAPTTLPRGRGARAGFERTPLGPP
jgi:hypothetical protein